MSMDIRFRSDLPVTIDDASNKGDQGIALRAWVEPPTNAADSLRPIDGRDNTPAGWMRVIRAMMKHRHSTPFEGGWMSVYCEAPAVVWWEWTRHRFMSQDREDFGFNLESGRYRVLDGEFYIPPDTRPMYEPEGFRPMRLKLVTAAEYYGDTGVTNFRHTQQLNRLRAASEIAWNRYTFAIKEGVAREVARLVLPFNIYYAGYVSANLLTWLHFLSLRTHNPAAETVSFPQWEIEQVANQCEALIRDRWPITYAAFVECERRAP